MTSRPSNPSNTKARIASISPAENLWPTKADPYKKASRMAPKGKVQSIVGGSPASHCDRPKKPNPTMDMMIMP